MSNLSKCLLIWCLLLGTAWAFPDRTVVLVVPYTASSGSDIIARILAPKLSEMWKQPVIVDNKPGASGNLGTAFVAQAPADGHVLLMAINTFTMTPAVYAKLPYDPLRDFEPIGKLTEAGYALAVNPQIKAKDLAELIALSKAKPDAMYYASPGNGTPHHLAMELLKQSTGLQATHVPYKGLQGALTDLMGGQVQMMFATVHSLRPHVQAVRLKWVASTGTARPAATQEPPTFREQGVMAMDAVDAWYGVLAPARTPAWVVQRLNKDFVAALNQADVQAALAQQGMTVNTSTPAQFSVLIKNDLLRWKKVVTDAGIVAD